MIRFTWVFYVALLTWCHVRGAGEIKPTPSTKPKYLLARYGDNRFQAAQPIRAFAVAPDGKHLATIYPNSPLIRIWDRHTGEEIFSVLGIDKQPTKIAFSADSKQLAIADANGDTFLRHLEQPNQTKILKTDVVRNMQFSPNGKQLLLTLENTVSLFELSEGQEIRNQPGYRSALFLKNGKEIVLVNDKGGLSIWNWEANKSIQELASVHAKPVTGLSLSFQNNLLLSCDGEQALLWDLNTLRILERIQPCERAWFVPNQTTFATLQEGKLSLHQQQKPKRTLTTDPIQEAEFSPDGETLIYLDTQGKLRFIHMEDGKEIETLKVNPTPKIQAIRGISLQKNFVTANRSGLQFWDAPKGTLIDQEWKDQSVQAIQQGHAKGPMFVAVERAIYQLDLQGNYPQRQTTLIYRAKEPIHWLALASHKPWLMFAYEPKTICLFSLTEKKIVAAKTLTSHILSGGICKNDRYISFVTTDGYVHLHTLDFTKPDEETFQPIWKKRIQRMKQAELAFSPDGQQLAVSSGGQVQVIETVSGKVQYYLNREFLEGPVQALSFSADGQLLATGTGGDTGVVRLWSTQSGKKLLDVGSHRGGITTLHMNHLNGKPHLFSCGGDGSICLWDCQSINTSTIVGTLTLEAAWEDLTSEDVSKGMRAVSSLIAGKESSLKVIEKGLELRQQKMVQITKWIEELDHKQFRIRDQAAKLLIQEGLRSLPKVREALGKKPSPEKQQRLQEILDAMRDNGIPINLDRVYGEAYRDVRLIYILEQMNNDKAQVFLQELAKGANDSRAAWEAKVVLDRLR